MHCADHTGSYQVWVSTATLGPVNLSSCLGVPLSLHDGESLLLLADLLQPLLLQEHHQGVPHVHHFEQLLQGALLFRLLLRGLVCHKTNMCTHSKVAVCSGLY